MKLLLSLAISSLLAAANCLAATTIEINAKIADVPAGMEIPAKPELLAKTKGVNVLSAPRVITNSGQDATIEVTQNVAAPDSSEVPLGVSLSIKPTLTEKGIAFTGKATDRFKHGQREGEGLTVLSCVAREMYFKGSTTSGSTVLLKGGAPTSASAKKEGVSQAQGRELVIYLSFKKVSPEADKKPEAKKKPEPKSKAESKTKAEPKKKPTTSSSSKKSPKKKKSSDD